LYDSLYFVLPHQHLQHVYRIPTCNDTSLLNFSSLLSHFKSSNFILNTNCLHFSCLYSETTLMFMSTESEWLKWWYEVGILLQMTTRGPEVTSNWNWNSSVVTDDQQTQSTGIQYNESGTCPLRTLLRAN